MKKLISSLYNYNTLLNENFKVPIFTVHPKNILIIKSPTEFYLTLQELAAKSQKRITISSLYVGTDHLEKKFIQNISKAKCNYPELDINILLDYNRANRETKTLETSPESSKSILLPLVHQGAKVNFYLTYKLSGWHQYFWRRQKWNEIISLHHIKLYIFDDDIIISGANLSNLYFTNRQDRYILIRNSSLCDYFDQLIKTISKFSLILQSNGSFKLNENWKYDPRKYIHRYSFKINAKKEIVKLNNEFRTENVHPSTSNDTIIFPLLQMNTLGIKDEEEFTSCLIKNSGPNSTLNLATGYFNLIGKYQKKLAQDIKNDTNVTILMASEESNGFYNGKGLLRYVPLIYTYYVRQILKKIYSKSNIKIRYYDRPNWSFHGKGIWLINNRFFLTMVGSTNFGYRSVYRDNEAQIVILTTNDKLKENFQNEFNDLVHHSRVIHDENDLPKIPFLISIFARICRSFF